MNFFELLYKNQILPHGHSTIGFGGNKGILDLDNGTLTKPKIDFGSFILVPDYLDFTLLPEYGIKKIKQANLGYAIDLQGFDSVKDYVKSQYKTDANKIIKRHDRLYQCFDINYKVFTEEITKEEYEFLMVHLKNMLVNRFEQRNDKNKNLSNWSALYSSLYQELRIGKALLMVIYNEEHPIQMTVSYRLQHILFSAIPAYDIDYSKFGIGNTAIYKQIEWCLQHGFKIVEMGYGDLEYKRRWSNFMYSYKQHIIYNKHHIIARLKGFLIFEFMLLKEYLKRKNLKNRYQKFTSTLRLKAFWNRTRESMHIESKLQPVSSENIPKTRIDIKTEAYSFLRKHVYDFQYVQLESSKNILVYQFDGHRNSFIIQGAKKEMVVTIKQNP